MAVVLTSIGNFGGDLEEDVVRHIALRLLRRHGGGLLVVRQRGRVSLSAGAAVRNGSCSRWLAVRAAGARSDRKTPHLQKL
jgi:hypothetical protein